MSHTSCIYIYIISNNSLDIAPGKRRTAEASKTSKSTFRGVDGYGYRRGEDHVARDRQGVPRRIPHPVLCVCAPVLADTADEVVLGFGELQTAYVWTPLKSRTNANMLMKLQLDWIWICKLQVQCQ